MAPRQRIATTQSSSTYDESSDSSTLLSEDRKGITKKTSALTQELDIAIKWHDYFNLVALVRYVRLGSEIT
jgi:hypothetical protein